MRIDSIEVFLERMPLISPWRAGHGDESAIESVFVRMGSGGLSGVSEVTAPDRPGSGAEPDPGRLRELCVARESVG